MTNKPSFGLPHVILFLAGFGISSPVVAVAQAPASRLAGDWRSTPSLTIPATTPPAAQSANDLGAAQPELRLDRMLLLLQPSAAQQQQLTAELASQQISSSPEFHHWFTPAAFAGAYSNSAADVAAVSAWLENQGFQVAPLPAGRAWIEFSGTVAQVEQAFQTQIDTYQTAAGPRSALAAAISVPAALLPLVEGLVSLDGTLATPALTAPQPVSASAAELAAQTSPGNASALTPQLGAALLRFDALAAAGNDGAGESIAIAARSDIRSTDVAAFRAAFSLPGSPLTLIPSGVDPGFTADQAEATLAASWAGVAAPRAQIVLVPAATTGATDGLDLSLAAIVDQGLAHTIAVGYSACEAALSPAHQAFYSALYRQAAAQGIAVIAASGDSGPSACHAAGSTRPVTSGYGVNALASTPWNTSVGVAAFGAGGPSTDLSTLAAWSPLNTADPAYAGGGGASTLYALPAWQPAPEKADATSGYRQLPDLALPAAVDSGGNHGLAFCLGSSSSASGCAVVSAGGSSAAAALFAGIAALVAQQYGAQGNLAPNLYALSRYSGIFADVLQGSAQLSCAAGTPGCGTDQLIGFTATAGYDKATGLGTVYAKSMLTGWARPQLNGAGQVTVKNTIATGQTINPSGSVVLSANVTSDTAGPAPTGSVTFFDEHSSTNIAVVPLTPGSGKTSTATTTAIGVLAQGAYLVQAQYSGDATYAAAADPVAVVVDVEPSNTTTALTPASSTPTPGSTLSVFATIAFSGVGGGDPPTGTVNFMLDGVSQGTQPVVPGTPSTATILMTAPYVAGAHRIAGVYTGDANYKTSTSQTAAVTLVQSPVTVALTPATTTPAADSSLALSATITPPAAGAPFPTGTVNFIVDGNTAATIAVVPGSPSTSGTTITVPASGSHILQATYSGNSNYTFSQSPQVNIVASTTATTLVVTPATIAPVTGASLLLTASVTAASPGTVVPTGTVTFTLDEVVAGPAPVISGTAATLTIAAPSPGPHAVAASYNGDSYFSGSTAPAVALAVAKLPTSLVVTPGTTTPTAGNPLQATATITAAGATLPTGTVTFSLDGTAVGTAPLVSGLSANLSFVVPTAGAHTLAAAYNGDSNYATSTAPAVTLTAGTAATTLLLTPVLPSGFTTPVQGAPLVVTAAINATGPTPPTGTVSFTLDGLAAGTSIVIAGAPSTAVVTLPGMTPGAHVLQAVYSGDTNYKTSSATPLDLSVAKSPTTIVLIPASLTPTAGGSVTVVADIASSNLGSTYPSGTVTFQLDGVSQGSATVLAGLPSTATAIVPITAAGTHLLSASYSGDADYLASTAAGAVSLVVALGATTTTLTAASAALTAGSSETLTAKVAPIGPVTGTVYTVTGTVSFYDGANLLGKVAVSSGAAILTGAALADNTDHSITAIYAGDSNWLTSTSATLTLVATTLPDFVVLTSNYSTVQPGQALVLTLTVTPTSTPAASAEQNPTGAVVFLNGATVIGQAALTPAGLGGASTATLTTQTLPGGQDPIYASYRGDLYYDAGTSNLLNLIVEDFTIAPSSENPDTNLNIVQGAAGAASFTVTGLGGFNNAVQVVCAVPAQDDMTCTATPQQVVPALPGANPCPNNAAMGCAQFIVQTFTSGGPSSTAMAGRPRTPMGLGAAGDTALAVLAFFLLPFGRRARIFAGRATRRFWILLLLLIGLGTAAIGCTSVSGSASSTASSGTPLGVATLTITASAYVDNTVVSHSVYLTINVVTAGSTTP